MEVQPWPYQFAPSLTAVDWTAPVKEHFSKMHKTEHIYSYIWAFHCMFMRFSAWISTCISDYVQSAHAGVLLPCQYGMFMHAAYSVAGSQCKCICVPCKWEPKFQWKIKNAMQLTFGRRPWFIIPSSEETGVKLMPDCLIWKSSHYI